MVIASRDGDQNGTIARAYALMRAVCLSCDLLKSDADDVSQEVLLWLLRNEYDFEAITLPWLAGVTHNFALRHRRARAIRAAREGVAAASAFQVSPSPDETQIVLNELERVLPGTEARFLHLLREEGTLLKVAIRLGIPKGSVDKFLKRLKNHIANALHPRRRGSPAPRIPTGKGRVPVVRPSPPRPGSEGRRIVRPRRRHRGSRRK